MNSNYIDKAKLFVDEQINEAKRKKLDYCTIFMREFPEELRKIYAEEGKTVMRAGYGIYIVCW